LGRLLILSALLLSSCHAYDGFDWRKERDVQTVTITKIESTEACRANESACARVWPDRCTIYVPPNSPALIGHEAAHCFGYGH
jgi:hypothetical protein